MDSVPLSAVDGEAYLLRANCEFGQILRSLLRVCRANVSVCFTSERDDWILSIAAAGLGICFIPEFSAVIPHVLVRPTIPEVCRTICIATVRDREHSVAVRSFLRV